MGTSKIIMLSGIYTILGAYVIGFNSMDNTSFNSALAASSKAQAEQLARTGISLALNYMGSDNAMSTYSQKSLTTMGGTASYQASNSGLPTTQSQVVCVGTYNGKTVTMTATFHYYGGRWKILRIYTA